MALLAVPLTTPFNISTMELSSRPLCYASARQRTFISAYMLHTHSQLIYLPCLRIKEKGVGGGSEGYASKHFHYVVVYVLGWGDGENLSQVASRRLCVRPHPSLFFPFFFVVVMKPPARGSSLPTSPQKKQTKKSTTLA